MNFKEKLAQVLQKLGLQEKAAKKEITQEEAALIAKTWKEEFNTEFSAEAAEWRNTEAEAANTYVSMAHMYQSVETDLETITTIVARYYDQDTWKADLIFEEDSFELLQDILEEAGELKERAPYQDLVTTEFAKKAVK